MPTDPDGFEYDEDLFPGYPPDQDENRIYAVGSVEPILVLRNRARKDNDDEPT